MSDTSALIRKLRANREIRVELEPAQDGKPAKVIIMLRPPEAHFTRFISASRQIEADVVLPYITGWDGITEEDLLGKGIGATDPVPFSPELFAEVADDKLSWLVLCAKRLVNAIEEHALSLKDSQGN